MYRNRFEPCSNIKNTTKIGYLKLFNKFLTTNEDIISHVIISSNEIKILNLNTGVSRILPNIEIKCAILYEQTKLICGCYTSSCLFRDNYVIDNSIKMLDLKTGNFLQEFRGHTDLVTCLRVITNNDKHAQLVSGSLDKTIRLWNLETSVCLHTFKTYVTCLDEFVSDMSSYRLISGSWNKSILVWDLDKKDFKKIDTCHTRDVSCLKYLYCERFASGSYDNTIKIWSITSLQCEATLRGHSGGVNSLDLTPNRDQLVSCSDDKTIRVWSVSFHDATNGVKYECIRVLKGHHNSVRCIKLNLFTGHLFSVAADQQNFGDHSVKVWDMDTGKCLRTIQTTYYIHTLELCSDIF